MRALGSLLYSVLLIASVCFILTIIVPIEMLLGLAEKIVKN